MREINFNDAQQAVGFLTPQLLRINTEIDMQKYPSFDYARMIPVNTDGDMWDYGSVFYSGDIAGKAEFMGGSAYDMPYADISTTQFLQENRLAGIGYEWSRQELERAARMGQNLSARKAEAARKVAEQFVYGIAIRGNTEKNWTGLINNASVPTANFAADGTGSSALWSAKSADLINRDINVLINGVENNTKETEIADTLLLPTTRLQYLQSTRIGDGADTILKFVRENNAYTLRTGAPLTIIGSRELETAGASSTARAVAYARSPDVVQLHLPGPHEFFEPFRKGAMVWEVPGLMNVGGVEVRRPKGLNYRDGL